MGLVLWIVLKWNGVFVPYFVYFVRHPLLHPPSLTQQWHHKCNHSGDAKSPKVPSHICNSGILWDSCQSFVSIVLSMYVFRRGWLKLAFNFCFQEIVKTYYLLSQFVNITTIYAISPYHLEMFF